MLPTVKTFRELYCERHNLSHAKFERRLVFRCLHWHAKPLWWLLWLNRDYYSADYEFVRGVGDLRSRRDFRNEASEFYYHPNNRGLLRTTLNLRVSIKTLQAVFEREILVSETTPPMPLR
jgi:hypothetical protein